MKYRLWVNEESTVMIEVWENGDVTVATRAERGHTWGPPVRMHEEDTGRAWETLPPRGWAQ